MYLVAESASFGSEAAQNGARSRGRDGPEGQLRRGRGPEQARGVDAEVPDRARDCDELG